MVRTLAPSKTSGNISEGSKVVSIMRREEVMTGVLSRHQETVDWGKEGVSRQVRFTDSSSFTVTVSGEMEGMARTAQEHTQRCDLALCNKITGFHHSIKPSFLSRFVRNGVLNQEVS